MGTNVTRLGQPAARSRSGGRTTTAGTVPERVYPTVGSAALAPVERADQREPAGSPGPRLRVAPPPPVAVPRTPFVLLVLLVVVGGVLGILLLNTKINQNAFLLHDLRAEQAVLDQRQQQLEQEIAEADSSAQLAAAAKRLGLVQTGEPPPHLQVPGGEVYGAPGPGGTTGQAGD